MERPSNRYIMQTDYLPDWVVFTLDMGMTNLSYKLKYKRTHTILLQGSISLPASLIYALSVFTVGVCEGGKLSIYQSVHM